MPEMQAGKTEAERKVRARAAQEMCLRDSEEMLKRFILAKQAVPSALRGQALILVGNITFTYGVLKLKGAAEANEQMSPPPSSSSQAEEQKDRLQEEEASTNETSNKHSSD
jgi:small-conductance mechanosensitive channel